MKILKFSGSLLSIVLLVCCGTPKPAIKPVAAQVSVAAEQESASTVSDNDDGNDLHNEEEIASGKERWLGSEIVQRVTNQLKNKLSASAETTDQMESILVKAFSATGRDIDEAFTLEEVRFISKELLQSSTPQLEEVLNENQVALLKEMAEN